MYSLFQLSSLKRWKARKSFQSVGVVLFFLTIYVHCNNFFGQRAFHLKIVWCDFPLILLFSFFEATPFLLNSFSAERQLLAKNKRISFTKTTNFSAHTYTQGQSQQSSQNCHSFVCTTKSLQSRDPYKLSPLQLLVNFKLCLSRLPKCYVWRYDPTTAAGKTLYLTSLRMTHSTT